ncbi:ABC transporter permease [Eubacterium sp. 1001713B170207_170306_E7]|uniref:ABC transporter permease n=1 Tax=Eubacterium sp. 1001713B170207_170306_E7 TaxID=2787097 RepID=UPI001898E62D|nr:ABC transporter permease [Eubacterium sp. 1001713B170207_170306_E7]
MFFRIFKNDLRKKKTTNSVLLIFIVLSAMLAAGSMNLMVTTATALDYFFDAAKISDAAFTINYPIEGEAEMTGRIQKWVESSPVITDYQNARVVSIKPEEFLLPGASSDKAIASSMMLYLQTIPEDMNLVFNEQNALFKLNPGEMAVPVYLKSQYDLEMGDTVKIKIGGTEKAFRITAFTKDAAWGAAMVGVKRLMVSDTDFRVLKQLSEESGQIQGSLLSVQTAPGTKDIDLFTSYSDAGLPDVGNLTKGLVRVAYMAVDGVVAAFLFLVCIFLTAIGFLILRFTIVSAVEDDYREIGVMKALGFKNRQIRRLYLSKYIILSLMAGTAGFLLSIPFAGYMSKSISESLIMPQNRLGLLMAALGAALVVGLTLLFCQLCLRRLARISPVDAIRQGNTGERFKPVGRSALYRRKKMPPVVFIALNDLISRFKSYTVLAITFVLCIAVMIIPLNLRHFITGTEMMTYLGMSGGDFYVAGSNSYMDTADIEALRRSIEDALKKDIPELEVQSEYISSVKISTDDEKTKETVSETMMAWPLDQYAYTSGTAPQLKNEVALTESIAARYGKTVGNTIRITTDSQEERDFIITGLYNSGMNLGNVLRLGPDNSLKQGYNVNFVGRLPEGDHEAMIDTLKANHKDLKVMTPADYSAQYSGGFADQLNTIVLIVLMIIALIVFLITALFIRLRILEQKQSIAIMRSSGFRVSQIRNGLALQIFLVLMASAIAGSLLSGVFGEPMMNSLFSLFGVGGHISFSGNFFEIYILCPLALLAVVMTAVFTGCGKIKRIHIWDITGE